MEGFFFNLFFVCFLGVSLVTALLRYNSHGETRNFLKEVELLRMKNVQYLK